MGTEYSCSAYLHATEALDDLINKRQSPDYLIVDFKMPTISGETFIAEVKRIESLKNLKIIVFSSADPGRDTINDLKKQGIMFFLKANSLAELNKKLKKCFHWKILKTSTSCLPDFGLTCTEILLA